MEQFFDEQNKQIQHQRDRQRLLESKKVTYDSNKEQLLVEASRSLDRANKSAFELQDMGESILSALQDQRQNLKAIHRKILDVANSIGLSRALLRVIERRQLVDKIIVYCGMIITSIILFILWYYFR